MKGRGSLPCGHREAMNSDGQGVPAIVCGPGNYGLPYSDTGSVFMEEYRSQQENFSPTEVTLTSCDLLRGSHPVMKGSTCHM